jgi:16S rRNA (guanine1207-N2)-methyltransferase
MDPRSEVLLRQAELFQGSVLLAGLPADDLLGQLPQAHGWTWHAGDQAMLEARFAGRNQHGVDVPDVAFDAAVLFLPKSRELAAYLLNALASRLAGRELYLVGEKRGGIEGAAKQLQAFGKPRKLDSARHCQLWQVTVENAPQAKPLESLAERFELELADGPLKIVSLPGVFSHGRLDRGTALLLEHLDGLPVGHVLDFGCGAGVIGSIIKRRYPDSQVTLLDVDAFAVASSRLTLAANGLQGEVISGDGIGAARSAGHFEQSSVSYRGTYQLPGLGKPAEKISRTSAIRWRTSPSGQHLPALPTVHPGGLGQLPDTDRSRRLSHLPGQARLKNSACPNALA